MKSNIHDDDRVSVNLSKVPLLQRYQNALSDNISHWWNTNTNIELSLVNLGNWVKIQFFCVVGFKSRGGSRY